MGKIQLFFYYIINDQIYTNGVHFCHSVVLPLKYRKLKTNYVHLFLVFHVEIDLRYRFSAKSSSNNQNTVDGRRKIVLFLLNEVFFLLKKIKLFSIHAEVPWGINIWNVTFGILWLFGCDTFNWIQTSPNFSTARMEVINCFLLTFHYNFEHTNSVVNMFLYKRRGSDFFFCKVLFLI